MPVFPPNYLYLPLGYATVVCSVPFLEPVLCCAADSIRGEFNAGFHYLQVFIILISIFLT